MTMYLSLDDLGKPPNTDMDLTVFSPFLVSWVQYFCKWTCLGQFDYQPVVSDPHRTSSFLLSVTPRRDQSGRRYIAKISKYLLVSEAK